MVRISTRNVTIFGSSPRLYVLRRFELALARPRRIGSTFSLVCLVCVSLPVRIQAMLEACRGLRSAKEGLNQTVLLKALGAERDLLAERLGDAEAELKQIHHGYNEMMTPEMATG